MNSHVLQWTFSFLIYKLSLVVYLILSEYISATNVGQNVLLGVIVIVWPWPATKGPQGHSTAPPSTGVGERMERKRQKLVAWDKNSLTEQQTKGTVTTPR